MGKETTNKTEKQSGEWEKILVNDRANKTLTSKVHTELNIKKKKLSKKSDRTMTTERCGVGWEVGGKFKRQRPYTHRWLIHAAVWQKPTQHCKAIILQFNINTFKQKKYKNKKWEEDLNKHFPKDTKMANRYKMPNITNQGNANQNHKISPHTCQSGCHQNTTNKEYWRGCGEKGTSCTAEGNKTGAANCGKLSGGPQKTKTTHDPAFYFWVLIQRKRKQ